MNQSFLPRRRSAGLARQIALAAALAAGTAVLAVPGFTDAAYAQKRDKSKGAKPGDFSKEFIAAYQPLDPAVNAPGADIASLRPQLLALASLAKTADERQAAGILVYNSGIIGKDEDLQLKGADLMLSSGKLESSDVGRYNTIGYDISIRRGQYAVARDYLQRAIDLNYSNERATTEDLRFNLVETYFAEGKNVEGLSYLSDLIATTKAKGQQIKPLWYRRGVSVAYTNKIVPQVYDLAAAWVTDYPSPENWRDAIGLTRNLNEFDNPVLLDLLRLSRKVGALNSSNEYIDYVEAANPIRLPQEVKDVIDQAYRTQTIRPGSDTYVDEQYRIALSVIEKDKTDLPNAVREASAASATASSVLAAADPLLNYGDYDKSASFYEKALGLPGVDRNLVLTRLGIALIGKGDMAAAREALSRVEGTRAPVAKLWMALAAQQSTAAGG